MGQYKFQLIYKASEDGFEANNFHDLCDNQGPTLCILRSKDGDKFGGFTNIPWQSEGDRKQDRGKSFIYRVSPDGQVIKLNHNYGSEVGHNKDFSMIFYSAFYVKFQDGEDKSGFHELRRYYQKPIDADQDSMQAKYFLSNGKDDFKCDEIEVFKVIMPY